MCATNEQHNTINDETPHPGQLRLAGTAAQGSPPLGGEVTAMSKQHHVYVPRASSLPSSPSLPPYISLPVKAA